MNLQMDRFDFEQNIMNCWQVVEDIKLLSDRMTSQKVSEATVKEYIDGLSTIYQLKFEELFDNFSKMIASGRLS